MACKSIWYIIEAQYLLSLVNVSHALATHGVVYGLAAFASPRSSIEMQNLRPYLNLINWKLHFNKIPSQLTCSFKFEKPCTMVHLRLA